jgi:hypothetical protein
MPGVEAFRERGSGECPFQVTGISPDLFHNERLDAVFKSQSSPDRI